MKRSLEKAIYMQRGLFPDLFYVCWLISDKVFEEREFPEDLYLYEELRNQNKRFRETLAGWVREDGGDHLRS